MIDKSRHLCYKEESLFILINKNQIEKKLARILTVEIIGKDI